MSRRAAALLVVVVLAVTLIAGCAATRTARGWQPGEPIICPRCGQQFAIPEKLGP